MDINKSIKQDPETSLFVLLTLSQLSSAVNPRRHVESSIILMCFVKKKKIRGLVNANKQCAKLLQSVCPESILCISSFPAVSLFALSSRIPCEPSF